MVTYEEIKTILANTLGILVKELEDETPLQGGSIESIQYIELLLTLETKYGITATNDEFEGVDTIGDLTRLITDKINNEHGSVL